MLKSSLEDTQEANRSILDEFKIPEGVERRIQLPDYDDCRCFDLPSEADLTAIPKRTYEGFAKASRLALKHHLFTIHMSKNLFKTLRKTPLGDKKAEFKQ